MTLLVACARFVLVATLALAAWGKLRDRRGSRRAVRDLGVPPALVTPTALALPVVELTVAAALSTSMWAPAAAVAATALLAVFTLVVALNLAAGRRPACHCFGQVGASSLSGRTLARNGALTAMAGWLAAHGGELERQGVVGWVERHPAPAAAFVVSALVLTALAAASARRGVPVPLPPAVRRTARRLLGGPAGARARGVAPGTPAPWFELPDLGGRRTRSTDLLVDAPLLLVFVHPTCEPCTAVLRDAATWQEWHADRLTVAVVGHGTADTLAPHVAPGLRHVLVDEDGAVAARFRTLGTPTAVLVGADGRIRSRPVTGPDEIRDLFEQVVGGRQPSADRLGVPPPGGGPGSRAGG